MKKQIIEKIKQWDTIIIHRHARPDPDAIGSQAGLKALINLYFPDKSVKLAGEEEASLSFLSPMDTISDEGFSNSLVIVCDTANVDRIDDERYKNGQEVIKIDHHPNVDEYGSVSWVDTSASSTSEMIFELFLELEKEAVKWCDNMARLLYAGIVGDTGRFRFPNTTQKTFLYASRLIQGAFAPGDIFDRLYEKSLPLLRLEGYVLSEITVLPSGAGYITLPKEKLVQFGVTSKEASMIVNSFSALKGIKAWVFFVEESDTIRVRLRSKGPHIHELAARFNGGGHPLASGASANSWDETKEILAQLDKLCQDYK
ncbi:DHH family phosphoesterase [Salipaludibacillus neizhouensis]|uniref:DHH family phosphoesterase n=1 Tax=Salipaludibacillus neizhouensis TaxID=885475 RepID=A0A3A9KGJ7_9BACI|nr:bifunctional oligoribonuclease/PAP phosphatase NrnA [Salipaludibacillus neizhouensis]RKL66715.1 DHH family phosphoesterase [Salipaludibacillus neizhouensis]